MPLPKNEHCTYAEYLTWDTEDKYELFDGVPVMQARPSAAHQNIEDNLTMHIKAFLRGKPCKAFSELEVVLPDNDEQSADDAKTVVIPDLIVVCDPDKMQKQHCLGAPTLVVEILSPATAKADKLHKKQLYQRVGVPEYWIIDPVYQSVDVFILQDKAYQQITYVQDGQISLHTLPGLTLKLSEIFEE